MYKLIVLSALVAVCLAAPRPSVGLVPVYSAAPVAHVPVSYSSQSSTVVHSAPVYSAPLVRSVAVEPVVHAVPVHHVVQVPVQPVLHSVPYYY